MGDTPIAIMPDLPEAARCPACGYCLHAYTEPRCPECGKPFNPAQVLTALRSRGPQLLTLRARKKLAPQRPTEYLAAAGVWIAALCWSGLPCDLAAIYITFYLATVILIATLFDLLRIAVIFRSFIVPPEIRRWHFRRRMVVLIIAAAAAADVASPMPFVPYFWLSKHALDTVARQAPHAPYMPFQEVGLYPGMDITRVQGGVNFRIQNRFTQQEGLEYVVPGGHPVHSNCKYLGGGWYAWGD